MQATMLSCLAAVMTLGQVSTNPIPKMELEYQQQVFKQWWGHDLVLKLSDLPQDGKVPEYRTPYSGFDYPDRAGGTARAMAKYDYAYHGGRMVAADWERRDVTYHGNGRDEERVVMRRGLFGRMREVRIGGGRPQTPYWYGHCNGWTAAAIRHAEPQFNVVRNGVVFTPADIKGLLAEIYMYTETEFLGGQDAVIHPALLHVVLTNWLGRGSHPIGMEAAVGEVVINYPVYSYKARVVRHSPRLAEVAVTITYAMNTNQETEQPTRFNRQMYYHYQLDLDEDDQVVGGRYYTDSQQVDMLWAPLKPIQGGEKGNERGNPHLDVKEVLAIWRESVPADIRSKWLNIDPTDEDRVITEEDQVASADLQPAEEPMEEKEEKESTTAAGDDDMPPPNPSPVAANPETPSTIAGNPEADAAASENAAPANTEAPEADAPEADAPANTEAPADTEAPASPEAPNDESPTSEESVPEEAANDRS